MTEYLKGFAVLMMGAVLVGGLIAAPVACSQNDNDTIKQLVDGGADPIAARCAVSPINTPDGMCLVHAARGAK